MNSEPYLNCRAKCNIRRHRRKPEQETISHNRLFFYDRRIYVHRDASHSVFCFLFAVNPLLTSINSTTILVNGARAKVIPWLGVSYSNKNKPAQLSAITLQKKKKEREKERKKKKEKKKKRKERKRKTVTYTCTYTATYCADSKLQNRQTKKTTSTTRSSHFFFAKAHHNTFPVGARKGNTSPLPSFNLRSVVWWFLFLFYILSFFSESYHVSRSREKGLSAWAC